MVLKERGRFIYVLIIFLWPLVTIAQWNINSTQNNPVVVQQGDQYYAVSCTDGEGGTITAWFDNRGAANNPFHDVYLQRLSSNGEIMWGSGGVGLGVQTTGIGDIDITPDGAGGAVVTFIVGSGSTLNIYAQRIGPNGNKLWNEGNPVVVCNASDAQLNPKVARVGSTFVIVWEDKRNGSNYDLYAQQYSLSGTAQWAANGVVVNAATNDQTNPEIVSIGNEECIITWNDFRSGNNYDVYAQRMSAAGVRYWRGTDNLLSGRVISTAAANQRFPRICSDGFTGAIIAWQDFRNGTTNSTDIYAQRIDSSGTVKWTANGLALSTTTAAQNIQDITFTGDGAAVCWVNFPIGGDFNTYDIYAQKVDSTGQLKWGPQGLVVCDAPDLQNTPLSAPDGNGGAFFTWIDQRNGPGEANFIYAQRILSNGTAAWQEDGLVVCNNTNTGRTNPHLVSHGCTVTVIWDDARNTCCVDVDNDIYASRLDCNGNIFGTTTEVLWTGAVNSDWTNPGNWSTNKVPGANDDVFIQAGAPNNPSVNNGVMAICKSLKLSPGTTVNVATGGNLTVLK